jgi:hypothetical protein
VLGIHQPDVSNLLNGRVSKFSVGKLIQFAGKLNLVVQVKITKPKVGKLPSVAAASGSRKRAAADGQLPSSTGSGVPRRLSKTLRRM